jgi:hypothetical protein
MQEAKHAVITVTPVDAQHAVTRWGPLAYLILSSSSAAEKTSAKLERGRSQALNLTVGVRGRRLRIRVWLTDAGEEELRNEEGG